MLRNLTGVRCVVFDAVGTLIFSKQPVAEVYHEVGQRHGSTFSLGQTRDRFKTAFRKHYLQRNQNFTTSRQIEHTSWRSVVRETFDSLDESAQEDCFLELWDYFAIPAHWTCFPDAEETVCELQRLGWDVAVASNFDERLESISQFHFPMFPANRIFHSAQIGFRKPDIGFFRHIQNELNLSAEELLIVGDDLEADIQGGKQAAWKTCHVNRASLAEAWSPKSDFDTVISLRELTRFANS